MLRLSLGIRSQGITPVENATCIYQLQIVGLSQGCTLTRVVPTNLDKCDSFKLSLGWSGAQIMTAGGAVPTSAPISITCQNIPAFTLLGTCGVCGYPLP
jgi:hypothetical protein